MTTASAIAKGREWVSHESPCRDRGMREALKVGAIGWPGPSGRPAPSP